jgi:hypothetical protein
MSHQLYLGNYCQLHERSAKTRFEIPPHHLTTHGVFVGASGCGKTGAACVLVEETLRAGVPVLMIDIKGDLTNLALAFDTFEHEPFVPWVEPGPGDTRSVEQLARDLAAQREQSLDAWGLGLAEVQLFRQRVNVRILTPGSTAGEPLHVLSSLEHPSAQWQNNPEVARASLSAAVSLVLRLLGRDPDPAKSREHVILSVLAETHLRNGEPADLGTLLRDLGEPPIETIGSLPVASFMSNKERAELAAALNALLASPTFASWREGARLDIREWLAPKDGKTQAVVVSVAHLDDDERNLVLGILLEEVLTWVRSLPGTKHLRAMLLFDEVYGYLPPHPQKPPTKQPLMSLFKQARAFGVSVIIATQNPMDLDYRALSNAGLWCVGRLQTDADRNRVIEGLAQNAGTGSESVESLEHLIKSLKDRWFLVRNMRAETGTVLYQARWALSFLRGPLTLAEIARLRSAGAPPIPTLPAVGMGRHGLVNGVQRA